jgi:hypothetical protein
MGRGMLPPLHVRRQRRAALSRRLQLRLQFSDGPLWGGQWTIGGLKMDPIIGNQILKDALGEKFRQMPTIPKIRGLVRLLCQAGLVNGRQKWRFQRGFILWRFEKIANIFSSIWTAWGGPEWAGTPKDVVVFCCCCFCCFLLRT